MMVIEDGYRAYVTFLAIKLHFTSEKYDYFRYHGKVKASPESYSKRRDKSFFRRIQKKYITKDAIEDYLVSNIIQSDTIDKFWVTDLSTESHTICSQWLGRVQAMSYLFAQECKQLHDMLDDQDQNLKDIFIVERFDLPKIIQMHWSGDVSVEFLAIMLETLGLHAKYDQLLGGSNVLLWDDVSAKCKKYIPFLKKYVDSDMKVYYNTFVEEFSDHIIR